MHAFDVVLTGTEVRDSTILTTLPTWAPLMAPRTPAHLITDLRANAAYDSREFRAVTLNTLITAPRCILNTVTLAHMLLERLMESGGYAIGPVALGAQSS